jgi:hypothetical protein
MVNHTLPIKRLTNSSVHRTQMNAKGWSVLPLFFIKFTRQIIYTIHSRSNWFFFSIYYKKRLIAIFNRIVHFSSGLGKKKQKIYRLENEPTSKLILNDSNFPFFKKNSIKIKSSPTDSPRNKLKLFKLLRTQPEILGMWLHRPM